MLYFALVYPVFHPLQNDKISDDKKCENSFNDDIHLW